ncbi:MAG: hypothetical protein AB7O59_19200 [Pirellulales bacterium]
MGRQYAGILSTIAFTAVVLQGLGRGAAVADTLRAALASGLVFAVFGFFVGQLAGWIVLASVQAGESTPSTERRSASAVFHRLKDELLTATGARTASTQR